jgi:hypothetical protein
MARWRLTENHYIHALPPDLDAVEWEYREVDRTTGRERRRRYPVPMYCETETVVSRKHSLQRGDFLYEGDPGPAMDPLDEEAKKISESLAHKWVKPPDFVVGQSFSDSLLDMLQKQFSAAASGMTQQIPQPVAVAGVSREEFSALQKQLEALMVQNSELQEKASKPAGFRKL